MTKIIKTITAILLWGAFLCPAGAEETLTWHDCIAEARNSNPELISAVESVNQEKANKDITASSLYPQLTGSLDASTEKATSTNSDTGAKTDKTTDSYSYGVSGTQLLFDGFKTANDVKSAAESVKAAQQGYRFTSS